MNKVAIVTGAAVRVGAQIARHLHQHDFNVMIHYHQSKAAAEALAAELNTQRADSAATVQADLNNIAEVNYILEACLSHWQRLDVLVNNASRFYRTPLASVTENQWDDLINSNVKGAFFLSQAAAQALKDTEGCIINITDVNTLRPQQDYSVYCIAKSGLEMLTKTLAQDLSPEVRVNAIAPGSVLMPVEGSGMDADMCEQAIENTLLKRRGNPEVIAKTVLFLAQEADYMTGQTLFLDGGKSLYS